MALLIHRYRSGLETGLNFQIHRLATIPPPSWFRDHVPATIGGLLSCGVLVDAAGQERGQGGARAGARADRRSGKESGGSGCQLDDFIVNAEGYDKAMVPERVLRRLADAAARRGEGATQPGPLLACGYIPTSYKPRRRRSRAPPDPSGAAGAGAAPSTKPPSCAWTIYKFFALSPALAARCVEAGVPAVGKRLKLKVEDCGGPYFLVALPNAAADDSDGEGDSDAAPAAPTPAPSASAAAAAPEGTDGSPPPAATAAIWSTYVPAGEGPDPERGSLCFVARARTPPSSCFFLSNPSLFLSISPSFQLFFSRTKGVLNNIPARAPAPAQARFLPSPIRCSPPPPTPPTPPRGCRSRRMTSADGRAPAWLPPPPPARPGATPATAARRTRRSIGTSSGQSPRLCPSRGQQC